MNNNPKGGPRKRGGTPNSGAPRSSGSSNPKKSFSKSGKPAGDSASRLFKKEDKPFEKPGSKRGFSSSRSKTDQPYGKPKYSKEEESPKRRFDKNQDADRSDSRGRSGSFKPKDKFAKPDGDQKRGFGKPAEGNKFDRKPSGFRSRPNTEDGESKSKPPFKFGKKPKVWNENSKPPKRLVAKADAFGGKPKITKTRQPARDPFTDDIRLNRYIANSGICSRREADNLIAQGLVEVNGQVITEMGYKVKPQDIVTYGGDKVRPEKPVYLLMNKPKDFITTMSDPEGRKTVMDLLRHKVSERVYPVGRLDRDTTGLLLFTNDGELAKKLTHPSHEVRKIYRVTLDKIVKQEDLDKLMEGVMLEDGLAKADVAVFVNDPKDPKKEIGIELHSGKNRIVRRMMEHLGYDVKALDRVVFAQLTKKDLPRGKFRFLTPQEVGQLKAIK